MGFLAQLWAWMVSHKFNLVGTFLVIGAANLAVYWFTIMRVATEPSSAAGVAAAVASIIGSLAAGIAVVLGAWNMRKIDKVDKTTKAVHVLTNSAMSAQLLTNVELLQALSVQAHRTAGLTKEDADNASAIAFDVKVEAAKKVYQDHQKSQAVVDAKLAAETN